jgi:2-polyprenyl-3-methyl-5-hydroxy-6-metoxy-1,4-benzoquinol methylase
MREQNVMGLQVIMLFDECPIGCNSKLVDSSIVLPECTLMRCSVCGQLLSSASEEMYQRTMKRFDDIHQIDMNPRVHIKRLSRLQHYWRKPPSATRVLDVGSSFGMLLGLLREAGFRAEGVEPSREAASKCREEGLEVHCGLLEEVDFPDDSFDVITLFEVIEHLRSPRSLLGECYKILKAGGKMFISTGNTDSFTVKVLRGKWDYFSMEDGGQGHISFFNPRSITILAKNIGFKISAIESKRVKMVNKKYDGGFKYLLGKVTQEILNPFAKAFNKGHDMLVVLEK